MRLWVGDSFLLHSVGTSKKEGYQGCPAFGKTLCGKMLKHRQESFE